MYRHHGGFESASIQASCRVDNIPASETQGFSPLRPSKGAPIFDQK
jgi:hypothetical protein